jgi:hypothetical protein
MSLLIWSATIAALIAGHFGGVWAGAGAAIATVIVEILVALWVGGRSKKRKTSKSPARETSFAPPQESPSDELETSALVLERQDRTRRPTDILLPVDDLPWNRSYRGDMYVPGRFANDFAFSETLGFFEIPKVEKSLRPQTYLQAYSQIKRVVGEKTVIESGPKDSDAEKANGTPGTLIAFRSRDGIWVGFQFDDERFRFRRAALTALQLEVGFPARGPGGFGVTFYFEPVTELPAESLWPQATANFDVAYSDQGAYEMLRALTELSLLWDIRLRVSQAMDV